MEVGAGDGRIQLSDMDTVGHQTLIGHKILQHYWTHRAAVTDDGFRHGRQ